MKPQHVMNKHRRNIYRTPQTQKWETLAKQMIGEQYPALRNLGLSKLFRLGLEAIVDILEFMKAIDAADNNATSAEKTHKVWETAHHLNAKWRARLNAESITD